MKIDKYQEACPICMPHGMTTSNSIKWVLCDAHKSKLHAPNITSIIDEEEAKMKFTQCETCIKADVCSRKSQIERTYKSIMNCSLPHMGSISVKIIIDDLIKITFECTAYKEDKSLATVNNDVCVADMRNTKEI